MRPILRHNLPMRGTWVGLTLVAVVSCAAQGSTGSDSAWETADGQVVRLNPKAFPELPENLAAALRRRGCRIPQVPMIEGRHNVIKGEFLKPGQTDWAVLCSGGGVSSILVFWNGSEANPTEIAKAKDIDRLQSWVGDKMVFSREIDSVGRKYIMEHYRAYGGVKPPAIDHQGINDIFYGKASEVLYFYRGRWLHLTGAD